MACDKSKQTLIDIEQNSSSAGDAAAPFFSADKLESLNRANEEVSTLTLLFSTLLQHCSS